MLMKMSQLRCKEVICLADGQRLGFVGDLELDVPDGCVKSLIVPGPCRFLGLFGRKDEFVIPWCAIQRVGPDIILVDVRPDECRRPRFRGGWF